MQRCALVFLLLASLFLLPGAATAQNAAPVVVESLGVTIHPPAGWNESRMAGNEKSLVAYVHTDTESQIEVLGTALESPEVASVLFDTFHQQLSNSDFVLFAGPKESQLGAYNGTLTEYAFSADGINLRVSVFSFVQGGAAFFVIGYFRAEERDALYPTFEKLVEKLAFS